MTGASDGISININPVDHLPLRLHRSEVVPPAPTFSQSTLDWLPDFSGYTWIAYGASSLLVIAHFPSPLSPHQTRIGPIFRQSFHLSSAAPLAAVSWSPQTPSFGDLAAVAENCIWVFSHDTAASKGSFCWSQNAVLVQRSNVGAIKWTGSGDGVVSVGTEIVLWKRSNSCWEMAWKLKADKPHNLVSATWSIEGPSAAAVHPGEQNVQGSLSNEAKSKCVLVCQRNALSEYSTTKLMHPFPVTMIQWRPSRRRLSNTYGRHSERHVLLTCCLDGTARLWNEIDSGNGRRIGNDVNDKKNGGGGRAYCVVAVIEINHALNGALGSDIFVTWGIEIGGIFKTGEGASQVFSKEGFEHEVGKCDWLVGFGPGMFLSLWAVHCLDDVSPLRFPRVTLWGRHEFQGNEMENVYRFDPSDFKNALLLQKVILLRNCFSGPPVICSPVHLLPCNSLVWSFFHIGTIHDAVENSLDEGNTENISHFGGGVLKLDGHDGKILKVSIHPSICEVQMAASLDSNGLLLFWSLFNNSNCNLGCPTLVPTWELCGKLVTQGTCSRYTSLRWAPSVCGDKLVIFMGHARGIDCFIVQICRIEDENIECHYLCTIPFTGHGPFEDGPSDIFAIPLYSNCNKTFRDNKVMLLATWMGGFQALSWEVILHSLDMSTNCCECNFDAKNLAGCAMWAFETTFASKRFCVTVNSCSSEFASPHTDDLVTCFGVVGPDNLSQGQQRFDFANELRNSYPAYIMATGCSDGRLKLWRSNPGNPSALHNPWELVGMFVAHEGPVKGICLTDCGRKIATFCNKSNSNTASTIHIWDAVNLISAGTFILEDNLTLESDVITLHWLTLGTGRLFLGVCLQNELRVYAQRRYGGLNFSNSLTFTRMNIWVCIAFAHTSLPICDFLWGSRATAVVIHGNYFSIFSHWLFHVDRKLWSNFIPCDSTENCKGEIYEDILSSVFTDCDIGAFREPSMRDSSIDCDSMQSIKINMNDNHLSSSLILAMEQLKSELGTNVGLWSILEIAEILNGSLPTYHPDVLLVNISSGNWKRAYVAMRHLVGCLSSNYETKLRHVSKKTGFPDLELSYYIEGLISKSSQDKGFQWTGVAASTSSSSQAQSRSNQSPYHPGSSTENMIFSGSAKSELNGFIESIQNLPELPAVINIEKTQILAIIDLLSEVSSPYSSSAYQSLDEPGRRFWVVLRFQQLHFLRKFGRAASFEELLVNSRLFVWAYHSDCQENLVGSVLPNEPSWQEMRALGMGLWFSNVSQLRARMEKLARAQYLKNKNPKDCALLYIALNRIQVLAGLFKISKDEKDKPLVGFLSRNFQDEKNKAAALKNAYVLLGKHQLELAIAFFLLGGDNSSAINICVKNLADEQLAIVICRLLEGHGGPLERHLIIKHLLPSAIDKGDYWLASLLEWEIGNYYQSFHRMLDVSLNPVAQELTIITNSGPFLDPSVGFYCQMLATKNSLRNAVGEQSSAILSRWATLMTATALERCGTPLEALECFSSPLSMLGTADQGSELGDRHGVLSNTLKPLPRKSFNWLSSNVSVHLEFHIRLNLALQYLSKLIKQHPSWPDFFVESNKEASYSDEHMLQYEKSLESFKQRLYTELALFEQRFSLAKSYLISMILLLLCHHGLLYIGYDVADESNSGGLFQKRSDITDAFILYHYRIKPLLAITAEISYFYSRFFSACCMGYSQRSSTFSEKGASTESISKFWDNSQCHFKGLLISLWYLRAILRIQSDSLIRNVINKSLDILDLFEYYLLFSLAWLQGNSEALFLMAEPLLIGRSNGHNPYEVDMVYLKKLNAKIAEVVAQNAFVSNIQNLQSSKYAEVKQVADVKQSVPDDERWKILGACLWQHNTRFMMYNLNLVLDTLEDVNSSGSFHGKYAFRAPTLMKTDSDGISLPEQIRMVSLSLCDLLRTTVNHVSSFHVKQLAAFLWQKLENNFNVMTLEWLKQPVQSESIENQNLEVVNLEVVNRKDKCSVYQILWDHCADPKLLSDCFTQEKLNLSNDLHHVPAKGWSNMYITMTGLHKTDDRHDDEQKDSCGSPVKGMLLSGHASASSKQIDTPCKNIEIFQNPREMHKRNGELLEALCINSIDQHEAALASNRKGIIFFHLGERIPSSSKADHLWSKADWPQNGWAGLESTPDPTCVSPGVALASMKGAHLGLGGATVGMSSLALPSRDLTGAGAFRIPGYAGSGASGLGWEVQQDFENFVDPPATVENTSTRVLSSHPLMPFFLVGSSNTHIYLWEFNKDKATATYGVPPAADVPPPYALASISGLKFDHCGHRFASAALDGTVCTWQLEVGGRSNARPTESSLCFNGHASDVTYFSSSGSIIAVAGYSSNGVNVVIWDTLAPPATSRASILCHEGGARSLSVFDNEVGSGSISPIIVTGGKGGDVGLHDFRYIVTGKPKRHRHAVYVEQSSSKSLNSDKNSNVDGMLWYIPKAHSGSVTKIVTIPNTSLFLTGSEDGDVKLWDAQGKSLIQHWSKLHEKHTFLQPSSHGFGGFVRAGVTDIQVVPHGFLTCGGDGTVKLVELNDSPIRPWC